MFVLINATGALYFECIITLLIKRGRMSVFHDEVEIEDFEYDEDTETYYYPCPCGDQFEITRVSYSFITIRPDFFTVISFKIFNS